MGGKRKYSSCSDRADAVCEASDFVSDVRSDRRMKRRSIGNRYFKHNSVGKSRPTEGKCSKTSEKVHDDTEIFVDADYKKYLDRLSSKSVNNVSTSKSMHGSDFGGDTVLENMSVDDALIDNIETSGQVDDCCKNYLDSLPEVLAGNSNFSKHRFVDNGDFKGDTAIEDASAYYVDFDDADVECENILEEEYVDIDYQDHLHSLALEDDHHDNFISSDLDVDAANGFVKNGNSGKELIENKFLVSDANDDSNNNTHVFTNVDLQFKNIEESNNIKDKSDKQKADYKEHNDNNPLGQSVDSAIGNDWSVDHASVKVNAIDQSMENDACCNWYEENGATDVDGGSFQTSSRKNNAEHSDDLENNDPDYKFFLENLREDGTSYVLEVPFQDGTTLSIKYEPHVSCRVENLDATRTREEAADLTNHDCNSKLGCDLMDESYKFFLNSLKIEVDCVVFLPGNGAKVVYDDNREISSDSEVMILDADPFANENYTPFVPSKAYVLSDDEGDDCVMGSSRNNFWFRERVTEILKKPYDQNEFERLLCDVYVRKPVEVEVDTRNGGTRRRILRTAGKSYYDSHKDLARRINAAGSNKPKVLNLLRGFFFWLQNMVHDGVFKPWEDRLCLEILPQGVRS